jgi:hypothetical protein
VSQSQTVQDDFSSGANGDVAAHLIDDTAAYDFVDTVLDDDGSAYKRGGTTAFSANAMTGSGRFILDAVLNVGRRTIVADEAKTYVLDSDDTTLINLDATTGMPYPKQTTTMSGLVFIGGGAITAGARSSTTHTTGAQVTVTNLSQTVTRSGGSWSGIVVPGHLMKIGTGRVYEVQSVESATSLTLRDAYQGISASSQTAVFHPIYRVVNGDPYNSAQYVAVCQNRVLWGSGRIVRFSNIGNPHVTGANDYHELPTGAQICGLADLGGTAIVFTTDGIWTIDGLAYDIVDSAGNGQHQVRRLSEAIVLAGAAGIAGHEQQLIVPASDGIFLLDGVSSPTRISRGIERRYKAWIKWGARLGQAAVYRGHYLLPIVAPTGAVRDLLVCRLDRPVRTRFNRPSWPWVRFAGDGGLTPAFTVRHGDGQLAPKLLGCQGRTGSKIVECSDFFNASSPNYSDADGTNHAPQITTRDYETGEMTENAVRSARLRYELTGSSGKLKVEWSKGGPAADVAGYGNPLRLWGDIDAEWGDVAGFWVSGFGPADPDIVVAAGDPAVFTELSPSPGASDGIKPVKCRINRRARYSRLRITCSGTVDTFRFRSLEIFTRPSQAVRR